MKAPVQPGCPKGIKQPVDHVNHHRFIYACENEILLADPFYVDIHIQSVEAKFPEEYEAYWRSRIGEDLFDSGYDIFDEDNHDDLRNHKYECASDFIHEKGLHTVNRLGANEVVDIIDSLIAQHAYDIEFDFNSDLDGEKVFVILYKIRKPEHEFAEELRAYETRFEQYRKDLVKYEEDLPKWKKYKKENAKSLIKKKMAELQKQLDGLENG